MLGPKVHQGQAGFPKSKLQSPEPAPVAPETGPKTRALVPESPVTRLGTSMAGLDIPGTRSLEVEVGSSMPWLEF